MLVEEEEEVVLVTELLVLDKCIVFELVDDEEIGTLFLIVEDVVELLLTRTFFPFEDRGALFELDADGEGEVEDGVDGGEGCNLKSIMSTVLTAGVDEQFVPED